LTDYLVIGYLIGWLAGWLICVVLIAENSPMSAEKILIKYLLDNYEHVGVVGRPVYNTYERINVSYGIGLIQILDLDEKNQILTTNVWCRYVSIL